MASERVTWENCPLCGRAAAVGWVDGVVVAVDCPGGCRPSQQEVADRSRPSTALPPGRRGTSVHRW
ncbi:hypothetical protein [Geodermatophilus sp. SYSU D00815]